MLQLISAIEILLVLHWLYVESHISKERRIHLIWHTPTQLLSLSRFPFLCSFIYIFPLVFSLIFYILTFTSLFFYLTQLPFLYSITLSFFSSVFSSFVYCDCWNNFLLQLNRISISCSNILPKYNHAYRHISVRMNKCTIA